MSKQFAAVRNSSVRNSSVRNSSARNWRKMVAALVLAAALTGLPLVAANVPGPLSNVFAQPAYACPIGGECG